MILSSMDIPGYKIEKLIAEGGMASVYLARQESLNRPVALKLLRKFDSEKQALRFFNEGRIIASLEHRNIITIFDFGAVGEQHYLAMEFLRGGDLKSRINNGMKPDEALELLETLGSCLSFVHQQGIIHRDIKPENILFRKDGSAVLTDFGVAKQMEFNSSVTMDGTTLGSPYYLSPEQAKCKALDCRADIYSLGIVCYEMLTGSKPFQADSPLETILAHLSSQMPPLPPHLSVFQPLLERMIALNPEDRFASAAEMVSYVQRLRTSIPKRTLLKAPPSRNNARMETEEIARTVDMPAIDADISPPRQTLPYKQAGTFGLIVIVIAAVAVLREPISPSDPTEQASRPQTLSVPAVSAPKVVSPSIPVNIIPAVPPSGQSLPSGASLAQNSIVFPESVVGRQPGELANSGLQQAKAILEDKNLTLPKLKRAYALYQPTLKQHPRHPVALRGINYIANKYLEIKNEIENLLASADVAVKNDRIDAPDEDNAAYYYRRILELDPEHPEAKQGLDKLALTIGKPPAAHDATAKPSINN